MNTIKIVEILEAIQVKDKQFLSEKAKEHGAATFCAECGQNTHVGLRPFWHRFARHLCDTCGHEYQELLCQLGAYDELRRC